MHRIDVKILDDRLRDNPPPEAGEIFLGVS